MQVQRIQNNNSYNTSFGMLKVNNHVVMTRLNRVDRYAPYVLLRERMEKCLVDCIVDLDEKGRISTVLRSKYSPNLNVEERESRLSAIFNRNPMGMIERMCKKAEEIAGTEEFLQNIKNGISLK